MTAGKSQEQNIQNASESTIIPAQEHKGGIPLWARIAAPLAAAGLFGVAAVVVRGGGENHSSNPAAATATTSPNDINAYNPSDPEGGFRYEANPQQFQEWLDRSRPELPILGGTTEADYLKLGEDIMKWHLYTINSGNFENAESYVLGGVNENNSNYWLGQGFKKAIDYVNGARVDGNPTFSYDWVQPLLKLARIVNPDDDQIIYSFSFTEIAGASRDSECLLMRTSAQYPMDILFTVDIDPTGKGVLSCIDKLGDGKREQCLPSSLSVANP